MAEQGAIANGDASETSFLAMSEAQVNSGETSLHPQQGTPKLASTETSRTCTPSSRDTSGVSRSASQKSEHAVDSSGMSPESVSETISQLIDAYQLVRFGCCG